ncbi:hypothetical protein [Rhodococcus artemisiae]|uniref:Uncharacterized protein n=1 Tax=Rhodococcus artemisiae TaxID=714159 RepID=A0ABU7LJ77_9NOCA|nr:hypothetical protein [Rhodococcus artemisiae]MEE2061555.1 hypothetical protein [Rhodococcus artemisiae]
MTTANPAPGSALDPSIVARAERVWCKAGVRRSDRREMAQELAGELAAATDAGHPPTTVTGDDLDATMRAWADERGVSARAGRYVVLVPAVLVGITAGMGFLLGVLYLAFANNFVIKPYSLIFGIYLVSGALAYVTALASAWITLAALGDPRRKRTMSSLAVVLPVGAAGAVAAGVAIAWLCGFSTSIATVVAVVAGVCVVLAAAIAFARFRSIDRRDRDGGAHDVVGCT